MGLSTPVKLGQAKTVEVLTLSYACKKPSNEFAGASQSEVAHPDRRRAVGATPMHAKSHPRQQMPSTYQSK